MSRPRAGSENGRIAKEAGPAWFVMEKSLLNQHSLFGSLTSGEAVTSR